MSDATPASDQATADRPSTVYLANFASKTVTRPDGYVEVWMSWDGKYWALAQTIRPFACLVYKDDA